TCPFLRPHVVSRSQYEAIASAATVIAGAFEKLVRHALSDDHLLARFGLTECEARLARIDPGYSSLCPTSRLDSYISESGFQFLEYNAESPAGVSDQQQLEKLLFSMAHNREFLAEHDCWMPRPHEQLLRTLLEVYRESGGDKDYPQIGIIDWTGVATASEFEVLKQYFVSEGYPTVIADPRALSYDDRELRAGDFRIDILYKRVIIHELLERVGEEHPLVHAYRDRCVCMANS